MPADDPILERVRAICLALPDTKWLRFHDGAAGDDVQTALAVCL